MPHTYAAIDIALVNVGQVQIYRDPHGLLVAVPSLPSHDAQHYLRAVAEDNRTVTVTVERRLPVQ